MPHALHKKKRDLYGVGETVSETVMETSCFMTAPTELRGCAVALYVSQSCLFPRPAAQSVVTSACVEPCRPWMADGACRRIWIHETR